MWLTAELTLFVSLRQGVEKTQSRQKIREERAEVWEGHRKGWGGWTQNWESQRCNRPTVVLAYGKRWHFLTKIILILFLKLEHKYFTITMEQMLFVKGVDKGKCGLKQLVALGGERRAAPFPKHNHCNASGNVFTAGSRGELHAVLSAACLQINASTEHKCTSRAGQELTQRQLLCEYAGCYLLPTCIFWKDSKIYVSTHTGKQKVSENLSCNSILEMKLHSLEKKHELSTVLLHKYPFLSKLHKPKKLKCSC